MTHQESITVTTLGHTDIHDITTEVRRAVAASGIETGICHIFNVGSTGSIGMIEFEPGLAQDLPSMLDRIIPPDLDYGHEERWADGNGHSHLQSTLLGQGITVPVCEGRPMLGTWQQIFHLECDVKPRTRTVIITVTGD